jgi:hypothetical protein
MSVVLKTRSFGQSLTNPQQKWKPVLNRQLSPAPLSEPSARTLETNQMNGTARVSPSTVPSLGPPMDIQGTASLLGCSAWTVRQRLIPMGLPHFQAGRAGKLIFYRDQIVRWIETQQKKNRFTL